MDIPIQNPQRSPTALPRWKAALLLFSCGFAIGQALVCLMLCVFESHSKAVDGPQGFLEILPVGYGLLSALGVKQPRTLMGAWSRDRSQGGDPKPPWVAALKASTAVAVLGGVLLAMVQRQSRVPLHWEYIVAAAALLYAGANGTAYISRALTTQSEAAAALRQTVPDSVRNNTLERHDSGQQLVFRASRSARAFSLSAGLFLIVVMGSGCLFMVYEIVAHLTGSAQGRSVPSSSSDWAVAIGMLIPVFLGVTLIRITYGSRLEVDTVMRTYRQLSVYTAGWAYSSIKQLGLRFGSPLVLSGSLDGDLDGIGIVSNGRPSNPTFYVAAAWRDKNQPAAFLSDNYSEISDAARVMDDLAALLGVAALGGLDVLSADATGKEIGSAKIG